MLLDNTIFNAERPFEERAMDVFRHQYEKCDVYRRFVDTLGKQPDKVKQICNIPLLPIEAFKEVEVTSFDRTIQPDLIFLSSGTGAMQRSRHVVLQEHIYRHSVLRGFESFFNLGEYILWAYLPGYSENPHSSLVWMVQALIEESATGKSRFLPLNQPIQKHNIDQVKKSGKKLLLFGAAFGLLDLIERQSPPLPEDALIIETGGIKTHRREMTRTALHHKLAEGFGLPLHHICSEYGMAEMLSQAYMKTSEWFKPVNWLRFTIRNPDNPMEELPAGEEGLIGIIDLANIYSCSFLLTGDRGIANSRGHIKILGRWNPDDMRGCNFLVEEEL